MTRRSMLDRPLIVSRGGGRAVLDLSEDSSLRLFVADTRVDHDCLREGSGYETTNQDLIDRALAWQQMREQLIFMADTLSSSIALDSNFRGSHGNFTPLGRLEAIAKRERDRDAIARLAEALTDFIRSTSLYDGCSVCAVPPSPDKTWHLPIELARSVARACDMPDLSSRVRFCDPKPSIKDLSLEKKQASLEQAGITICSPIEGPVLLLDDKYQSGTTAGFVGAALIAAGAAAVHGLFCVKTWRDRDNMSPPGAAPG